jgi:DNA invertase Pin-like site-specific DNA recombinase
MKIGYARVSTTDQKLAVQTDALEKAGCEKFYRDTASGAREDRKGLAEAIEWARAGDTLIVWKLDRLGRSLKHLIHTVNELHERAIGFVSLQENIDTTTSTGKLIFHVFCALAEFERDLIRERTQTGLKAARARGRQGGRPPKLNREQVGVARRLLSDPNMSVSAVCRTLKVGRTTLIWSLRRKLYDYRRAERER